MRRVISDRSLFENKSTMRQKNQQSAVTTPVACRSARSIGRGHRKHTFRIPGQMIQKIDRDMKKARRFKYCSVECGIEAFPVQWRGKDVDFRLS
jgi:hypothetical protein